MVKVGRWHKVKNLPNAVYIGRPSPLGNPFKLESESKREEVVERYSEWFYKKLGAGDKSVVKELVRITDVERSHGDVILGCYCSPKSCHGDVIAEFLNEQFNID